jgi:hypothetical protein
MFLQLTSIQGLVNTNKIFKKSIANAVINRAEERITPTRKISRYTPA